MIVLVTGATGFTGSYIVPTLLRRGMRVRCLARSSSSRERLAGLDVEWVTGDLDDADGLRRAMTGVDVLMNVASLGFGHAPSILSAAVEAGIKRAVFISTTAIFTTLNAPSKTIRLAAEEAIQRSNLSYTILRPTMIYGSSRDRNMCRLIRLIQTAPVIPIIGSGRTLQQPVYVEDVANAAVDCLQRPITERRCYNIPGAAPLTFEEVVDTVGELLGRHVRKLHLPSRPIEVALRWLEARNLRLPIKAEQVQRLNEDKAFSYEEAVSDFGYAPLTFREGIGAQIRELNSSSAPDRTASAVVDRHSELRR